MIRILESKTTDTVGKYWYYLICDEGDTKPTGEFPADSGKIIANGSRLFETGTEIRYELQSGEWVAIGQVDVPVPVLETLSVTPTSEAQSFTPESPVVGYSQVNVAAAPSANLIEKTIENILPPGVYPEQYDPAEDEADGYSLVTLTAPSAEEIAAEWIKIDLTVNVSNKTVTIDSTSEELTAAFETKQTDEPRFYVNITTII